MYYKLDKITKNELKMAKKERKRCKQLYPDWEDNEYNCGPLKFIWGVRSRDDLTLGDSNFYTLNDLDIYYNRDTKKYLLGLETIYKFDNLESCFEYLQEMLDLFYNYIKDKMDITFSPHNLYIYNDGNMFQANELTELYYKFKIFVNGFKNI